MDLIQHCPHVLLELADPKVSNARDDLVKVLPPNDSRVVGCIQILHDRQGDVTIDMKLICGTILIRGHIKTYVRHGRNHRSLNKVLDKITVQSLVLHF